MPLPDNAYVALFPVQLQTIDKTSGLPLVAGTYTFFEDLARTTPKNVYQRTENLDNTFTYTSLGNVLTLSAIGTFVDGSGNNIIPFMFPFEGLPSDTPRSTDVELYYIVVKASDATGQFTVSAWPPGVVGGSSNSNTIISSDNVISNPQFAIVNYPSPYTFNVSGPSTIRIAPDWDVITTGTGTVTISQIDMTDTGAPGLPAFGLNISSGSVSTIMLNQTINMSPRILENGFASGSFIVEAVTSETQNIQMNFVPSNPAATTIAVATGLAEEGQYKVIDGSVNLNTLTKNPDAGSIGNVKIQLVIDPGKEYNISCVQLLSVANETVVPTYIQETTPRQIDHLYHDAYPIIPVGGVMDFAGFATPAHFLSCDNTAYSRVTYNQLWRALTLTQSITQVNSTTFTVTNASQLRGNSPQPSPTPATLGNYVEGAGIPVGTYITSISGTTITVNQATTSTGTFTATFYAYGQGDGSTTFQVPNLNGQTTAGVGGSLFTYNTVGASGGEKAHVQTLAELATHNHTEPNTYALWNNDGGTTPTNGGSASLHRSALSIQNNGNSAAFNIVQPTTLLYKYIRYE